MAHPVQRIVEAITTRLQAAIPEYATRIYKYRTASLNDMDGELPAIVIRAGGDDPLAGASDFNNLGSLLTVFVAVTEQGVVEEEVVNALLDLRVRIHSALMVPHALGLSYVIEVGYAGAADLREDSNGEQFVKELTTRWQVAYRMNRIDPTVD